MTLYTSVPIVNAPYLSINDLIISNDATTPNTKLDVGTGICRDSTNTYDMVLSSGVVINAAVNGLNGLDTGTFTASKLYYVHLVSDPVSGNTTGAMISLSKTAPLMPTGYGVFRWIGCATTDGSTHFLLGYWSGNGTSRVFTYDAPQATSVTAGNSATYTNVTLTTLVPAVDNTPVSVFSAVTPSAAGRGVFLQGSQSTGNQIVNLGQVTSVVLNTTNTVLAQLVSGAPKIAYKVSNTSDAVALNIAGYNYYV